MRDTERSLFIDSPTNHATLDLVARKLLQHATSPRQFVPAFTMRDFTAVDNSVRMYLSDDRLRLHQPFHTFLSLKYEVDEKKRPSWSASSRSKQRTGDPTALRPPCRGKGPGTACSFDARNKVSSINYLEFLYTLYGLQ